MPADGVVGVDFFVAGAVLLGDEDGVADGKGVVECLRDGWGEGLRGGGGGGRWAEGEDGGTGGWEEGDFVRRVGWGHRK